MKARSLYLGLQCAQKYQPLVSCEYLPCSAWDESSADLWQWPFWIHRKRGILLVSLANVKQGLIPIIPAAHQLWKYILSHRAGGQWCSTMQYIVKLNTESQCEYLVVILENDSFFLCLRLVTKTDDQPRVGQWGGRREMERGVMYGCLHPFPWLLMHFGWMGIFPIPFPETCDYVRWRLQEVNL